MSAPWDIQSPHLMQRLAAVLGEDAAAAAMYLLTPELSAWAEYENAVTWETECLSCANMLSSCIQETVRAETAEKDLERYEEIQGEMNEQAINLTRKVARQEAELATLREDLAWAREQTLAAQQEATALLTRLEAGS